MSTCSQGNEMLLDEMDWSGAKDWTNPHVTKRGLWVLDKMPAGYSKALKKLNFVVVYNSGHLVPYNQPKAALDLITRYLNGTSFSDHELPIFEPSSEFAEANENHESSSYRSSKNPFHLHVITLVVGVVFGAVVTFVVTKHRKGGYEQV